MPQYDTMYRYAHQLRLAGSLSSVKAMSAGLTTLRALEVVAGEQPLGVSALSRRLQISKSAAQRALQTLAEGSWIRRSDVYPGRWVLTGKAVDVANQVGQDLDLRAAALPSMHELVDATTESAHLTILDGTDSVIVEDVESTQVIRIHWPIGQRSPTYACATGKAMLAALPKANIDQHLPDVLAPLTSITITDRKNLEHELQLTAERGYAIQHGELRSDVASIAAVICLPDQQPVAAVSVFIPAQRFPEDGGRAIGVLVSNAAAQIATRLSCRLPPS